MLVIDCTTDCPYMIVFMQCKIMNSIVIACQPAVYNGLCYMQDCPAYNYLGYTQDRSVNSENIEMCYI